MWCWRRSVSGPGVRTALRELEDVAFLDAEAVHRPCRQLDRGLGVPHDPAHPPRFDRVTDVDDLPVPVHEHDIEGDSHEEHVNGAARTQTEPGAGRELALAHKALEPLPWVVGYHHGSGDGGPG